MKLVIQESTANEISNPEAVDRFEKAVRAARKEIYKAAGKSYESRLGKLKRSL